MPITNNDKRRSRMEATIDRVSLRTFKTFDMILEDLQTCRLADSDDPIDEPFDPDRMICCEISSGDFVDEYEPTEQDYADLNDYIHGCMFHNYSLLASWQLLPLVIDLVQFENTYWVTFKPFSSNYSPTFDGMDHVRKTFGKEYDCLIITREIMATKTHYHALVVSCSDLMKKNDTKTSRYYITVARVNPTRHDVRRVHHYMIKESKSRRFVSKGKPLDIYVASRFLGEVKRYYNMKN